MYCAFGIKKTCVTVSVLLWKQWSAVSFKTPFGTGAAGSVGIPAACVTGPIYLRLKTFAVL